MNKNELQEVTASGIIEIQCHSATHDYSLCTMEKTRLGKELKDSKEKLEEILGKSVNIFAHPYGKYSQTLVDELMAQGYVFSVTTEYGCATKKAHPFLLPRIRAEGCDSGKALKKRIEGLTGRKTHYIGMPDKEDLPVWNPSPELVPGADQSSEQVLNPVPIPETEPGT